MLDVIDGHAGREMWVQGNSGGNWQDLGAVDHGRRIVAYDCEYAHNELEISLQFDLVIYDARHQISCVQELIRDYSLTKLCHSQAVLSFRAN